MPDYIDLQGHRKKSELDLIDQFIVHRPTYSIAQCAEALGVGITYIKRRLADGTLAHITMGYRKVNQLEARPIIKITGWAIIDFISWLENNPEHNLK